MTSLRRRLFTDYSDHPRKLVTLNPKLKSTGAGRYQLLSRWWMSPQAQLSKDSLLRKVRTLWHCSRLRSVALYLWLIVVISVRQRPLQQYLGFTAGRYYGFSSEEGWQPDCKIQRSGGTVREIDVWAESPRLSPPGVCIIVCLSWAVNHYRDNAITYKAQRDKNARELKRSNAAITDMQMCRDTPEQRPRRS